jgi:hypothetical protein
MANITGSCLSLANVENVSIVPVANYIYSGFPSAAPVLNNSRVINTSVNLKGGDQLLLNLIRLSIHPWRLLYI